MIFKRKIEAELEKWRIAAKRKPLLLMGARQVGKTTLLKYFGTKFFQRTAYFNFDENPDLCQFFRQTKNVKDIISNLSLVQGFDIDNTNTLIVFDEIQECKEALNSLKYFYENKPQLYIVGAGSLLGVTLGQGTSFPVGKVQFIDMYPLTYEEYLINEDPVLYDVYLSIFDKNKIEAIPEIFLNKFWNVFRMYFISGGMPEAVNELLETKNIQSTIAVLQNILRSYKLDFSKHLNIKDVIKIQYIWDSIPSQLARENRKFLYRVIRTGARAREYESALLWLEQAGMILKVNRITKPNFPLSAYVDLTAFKIYVFDIGILRSMANLEPNILMEKSMLFTEFKGAMAENYIAQSLVANNIKNIAYWTSSGKAEVDFLIQYQNNIIPVEVKSDLNVRSKSLSYYSKKYNPELMIRFSVRNLQKNGNLINIPLFLSDKLIEIIDMSL